MRSIREILRGFFAKPFSYWLGRDEPYKYEVDNGRLFSVAGSSRREILVLGEIVNWRRDGKALLIRKREETLILGDASNKIGAILEKEAPERWIVPADPS